jgi:3-dehydroquinate dehydratase/shikimate dehydrogenase
MAIVVSHVDTDFEAMAARALRQRALADLIELRLERCGDPGRERLHAFVQAAGKPVIVACHGREAFGREELDPGEVCRLLHGAAEAGVRFVDVDWSLALELGEVRPPCHRIVSRHVLEGTPEDLAAVHEQVKEVLAEGDVTKIVTHAATCEDGLRLLAWLRTTRGVVAFCSGAAGAFTRLLAPIFGSPFTYCAGAVLPGEPPPEPTAPGQWRVNDLLAALPPGGVNQETAILGVVGNPIGHSLSPRVQGLALKAARFDAVYVAFEPRSFETFLALASDESFRGLSVTAPFKGEAFRLASARDEASTRTRAANTLVREGAGWRAANTDVPAIRATLEQALRIHARAPGRPVALGVARALVLGTGGAARAAVHALQGAGSQVTVAGRDEARARQLAGELGCAAIGWSGIAATAYDVLVHATPVGSAAERPGELPLPGDWIRRETLVLDAVYRPMRTALLAEAAARGCTSVPGGEWFVRQAALQFQLFTRQEAPMQLLRQSFEHALKAEAPG